MLLASNILEQLEEDGEIIYAESENELELALRITKREVN